MQAPGYIALAVIVFFVALQWRLRIKAQRVAGQLLPPIDGDLAVALEKRGKVLLYFFSPHCGPCRAMTPVIDRLMQTRDNVFKVDLTRDMDMARKFRVMATPTLMLLSRDKIDSVHLGPASEAKIAKLLDTVTPADRS